MKTYTVFYYIKANRIEFMMNMEVEASNSKEACAKVKQIVKERSGQNAFRPTTKAPDADMIEFYKNKPGFACRITVLAETPERVSP